MADRLLTLQQVADQLQIPAATLYYWRSTGDGPKSLRVGRYVRYRQDDLDAWIADRSGTERTPAHT